jgi:iron complex transport system substrate-binding protein
VLLLPAAALALVACGGDDAGESTTSVTAAATTTSAGPSTAAPSTTTPTTTTAATTAPAGPHVVEHAMGETEVPAAPARIVVLDSSFLDASIALGIPPIGATEGSASDGLPAYLGDVVDGVELVGLTNEPNLEQIAALQPDLILAAKVRHEALYEQLSAIAPTVFSESSGTNWYEQVRLTGEALNRADQAAELIAEFETRAAAVGEAIGATGKTATIVRFLPDQTRLYGPPTFSGSVLTAVGFDLGAKDYDPSYGMALISAEQIDLVDSDVIFATTYGGEGSTRGQFESLWNNLPAVAAGQQFDIEDSTWMTGIGVIGANAILDDLETWLG